MGNKFDLVFLAHEKDKKILKKSLKYAKKNVKGYRKIFLIAKKNFFPKDKEIVFFNESKFPFSKKNL